MTDSAHSPYLAPYPAPFPVNYPKALLAMYRLTRDKENTRHVFDVVRHTNGSSTEPAFRRFDASEVGRKQREDRARLLRALDDRDRLRRLPEGTFGRTYADFMDREGLSTNGVQDADREANPGRLETLERDFPEAYTYFWYMNLSHDLYHVLTGYHRDALGEAALLRFTHEHTGSNGIKFIARMAGLRIRLEDRGVPVGKIMSEAARLGAEAEDFITTDWTELLDLPLGEVRERLNVGRPETYLSVPKERLYAIGTKFTKKGEARPAPAPDGTAQAA
jgi:ubiquinone biosynthesis protein COQ4